MITSVVNLIYYLVLRLIFKTTFKIKQIFLHSFEVNGAEGCKGGSGSARTQCVVRARMPEESSQQAGSPGHLRISPKNNGMTFTNSGDSTWAVRYIATMTNTRPTLNELSGES